MQSVTRMSPRNLVHRIRINGSYLTNLISGTYWDDIFYPQFPSSFFLHPSGISFSSGQDILPGGSPPKRAPSPGGRSVDQWHRSTFGVEYFRTRRRDFVVFVVGWKVWSWRWKVCWGRGFGWVSLVSYFTYWVSYFTYSRACSYGWPTLE